MDLILPFSFSDFPEDVQIRILSFLNQWELELFSRTSTRSLALCRDDERLWFLKCSRRWGSQTQIQKWGGKKISYRHLYHLLKNYENLIGVWRKECYRTKPRPESPPLVYFEWGSFYITGYRILPSKCGEYGVTKKPFLWITATSDGKAISYLDTTDGTLSLTEKDLLQEDSEKLRRGGRILVDVKFCGVRCVLLVENLQYMEFRRRLSTRNGQVEYESVYKSPPDGLMTQIYQTLSSKLSITGDPTSSKKERRMERRREREEWQRMRRWAGESLRKITEHSPSPSRPLQGLWKGVCPDRILRLYLMYYLEEWDKVICEKVEGYTREAIVFTAACTALIESPYSTEESTYNSRVHLRPRVGYPNQAPDHHVLRIFYMREGFNSDPSSAYGADGKIWLYADGTCGFGFLKDDYIVDLEPVIKNDYLLGLML